MKSTSVIVAAVPSQPNLVGNPSFEVNANNWNAYSIATVARVAGGFDGAWGLQVTGATTVSSFGCNDSPNWVASVTAGDRYRFTAWVRSAVNTGTTKIQVREYLVTTKMGALYSTGVTLSPTWQMITVDYVPVSTGSTLDFQVVDFPVVPSEVFVTDNISIRNVTGTGPSPVAGGIALPAEGGALLDPGARVPLKATLSPSPLRSQSKLAFVTSRPGWLRVTLYDVTGRWVRSLLDEPNAPAGFHEVSVDGRDRRGQMLASGMYFYRIQAGEGTSSGRFIVTH